VPLANVICRQLLEVAATNELRLLRLHSDFQSRQAGEQRGSHTVTDSITCAPASRLLRPVPVRPHASRYPDPTPRARDQRHLTRRVSDPTMACLDLPSASIKPNQRRRYSAGRGHRPAPLLPSGLADAPVFETEICDFPRDRDRAARSAPLSKPVCPTRRRALGFETEL
jgi:hypothetical protein